MQLIALLTIRRSELELARSYEHFVAQLMARHGGQLERAFELAGEAPDTLRELHLLRFPDQAAFDAFSSDPERTARAGDRARAIIATEVWPARELPRYG